MRVLGEVLSELHDLALAVLQLSKEYALEVFSVEEVDGSEEDTLYLPAKQSTGVRQGQPGMLSLQSKDGDTCAGGRGGSALPCSPGTLWVTARPATTELNMCGDTVRMCQLQLPTVPQGNDLFTQMETLSASPVALGTHPEHNTSTGS